MYNLCNLVQQDNLDTFYKVLIASKEDLPPFDELTPQDEIIAIMNSLPESFKAFTFPFLPDKHNVNAGFRSINGSTGHNVSVSAPLVPQDRAIKELLDDYQNTEVVVLLTRIEHSVLFGTQAQPLLFTYDEMHSSNKTGLKGYSLNMSGTTYGSPLYFEGRESEFPVINRGLAFQLAGSL